MAVLRFRSLSAVSDFPVKYDSKVVTKFKLKLQRNIQFDIVLGKILHIFLPAYLKGLFHPAFLARVVSWFPFVVAIFMGHENGDKQRLAKRRHVQGMLDETDPLRHWN